MWQTYFQPASLPEALALLDERAGQARVVAGGTDLIVELERGVRALDAVIDISRVAELKYLRRAGGRLLLGALTTHNDVLASPDCRRDALPLAQACLEVGAPQIRARATVAGNVITGSPANDTITPLMALGAEVVLTSVAGERVVPLDAFYTGVRRTVMAPNEILREIRVPAQGAGDRGLFLKLGLRRAQAISVIHVAFALSFQGEGGGERVRAARITLGCLAPTVIHATAVEAFLPGRRLDAATCAEAGRLARAAARPIGDLRGSAEYRLATLEALVTQGLLRIAAGEQAAGFPDRPVLLDTGASMPAPQPFDGAIETTINGLPYRLPAATAGKTLLNALREDAGLTGSKEGCAEGECGACTVWVDGQAAMSCLVPAAQAHHARITTIEGLAGADALHPLQQAFIDRGAVQCGFCIPGMIMAGAKLLDERPAPDLAAAQVAISGNICRCTGYRKILDAMLDAGAAAAPVAGGAT
jgi:xanthine dehydrogenase iron-sulfur cluster and FAD-binding subunit A